MFDILASLSRRRFLNVSTAAAAAALVGNEPRLLRAAGPPKIEPTADTVILLWMAGGMAHTETFDPKTLHPVRDRREVADGC